MPSANLITEKKAPLGSAKRPWLEDSLVGLRKSAAKKEPEPKRQKSLIEEEEEL